MKKRKIHQSEPLSEIIKKARGSGYVSTEYMSYLGYDEEWKPCISDGKEGREFVSSLGRLYDTKLKRLVSLSLSKYGYIIAKVHYKGDKKGMTRRMNRLVLETFVGEPPDDMISPEADHIDGRTIDNELSNLQWLSKSDNVKKENAFRDIRGERNTQAKYTEKQVREVCELIKTNLYSLQEISDMTNLPKTFIFDIKYQRAWKHITLQYDFSAFDIYRGNATSSANRDRNMKIDEYLLEGFSYKDICKKMKITYNNKNIGMLSKRKERLIKRMAKWKLFNDYRNQSRE